MAEHVTLLRPEAPTPGSRPASSSILPAHLLEEVRGRVRVLSLIILAAFAFDPLIFAGMVVLASIMHEPLQAHTYAQIGFKLVNLGGVLASAGLWWIARGRTVTASRLLTISLIYEVLVCFVLSILSYWQFYLDKGILPGVTWVIGVIILFPLIVPGPPRRMFLAALAATATSPLALWLLMSLGKVRGEADYMEATISPLFASIFAFLGARVVYGLGKEVAAARELGSYRLEEKLGQGGMGEVWRARHRLLARPAAIKVIRPAVAGDGTIGVSEEALRRFEREAQVIASLRSPHTVNLFDFGVAADGAFYYVMELLEGLDADRLVQRFGPVPAERAIYLLSQMCHSLSEAESRGLVHRDIKPANVFLCRYGEDHDFVKVLDFGLVKTLDESMDTRAGLTVQDTIHGTPAFIAPEQAMGNGNLDGRVDIYALGCVAYWLLTGQTVFSAANTMGHLMHHANTEPTAPSLRTSRPIPPALDRLVLACLEKSPDARPQSARDVARRLAEIDDGGWNEEKAHDWWAAHLPVAG